MKRHWLKLLLWVGVTLAAALACTEQRDARFSHELHLTQIECGGKGQPDCLNCTSCHDTTQLERARVDLNACSRCHKPAQDVTPKAQPKQAWAQPDAHAITFDHDKHLKMPEIAGQCVSCHGGLLQPGESAGPFPPMARCFECHEHQSQWDRAVCTPCHAQTQLSQLLPRTFLRHGQGWQQTHGVQARQQSQVCQQCHTQQQCDDCHDVSQDMTLAERKPDEVFRNLVHRGDWITQHPIEARSQPAKCMRCHTVNTCDSCHVRRGVSGNGVRGANPHPAGWVGSNPGQKSQHGQQARRDILTCAACHDQGPATNCIRCHRVGGFGGNPHPRGWQSARSDNAEMCKYCHGE